MKKAEVLRLVFEMRKVARRKPSDAAEKLYSFLSAVGTHAQFRGLRDRDRRIKAEAVGEERSPRTFWRAQLGFQNRLLALGMAGLMALFRKAQIDSVIEGYPDQGKGGVAVNDVHIRLLGVILYVLSEQYALGDDGASVYVRSYERFGPISFLFNRQKQHPAEITAQGTHATYYIPLLGDNWVGEYTVRPEGSHIESILTCPWARATESIHRELARG